MSQYTIHITPPGYLADWLRSTYWDAATQRVDFPRGSAPRTVMQTLLRKAPAGYVPGAPSEESVPVAVPTLKGLNPAVYCYLSPSGQAALVSACKSTFRAMLFSELQPLFVHDLSVTDIIYDFLDRHGIEPSERNWDTVRQAFLRMRKKSLIPVVK